MAEKLPDAIDLESVYMAMEVLGVLAQWSADAKSPEKLEYLRQAHSHLTALILYMKQRDDPNGEEDDGGTLSSLRKLYPS